MIKQIQLKQQTQLTETEDDTIDPKDFKEFNDTSSGGGANDKAHTNERNSD